VSWFRSIGAVFDGDTPKAVKGIYFLDKDVVNEHSIRSLAFFHRLEEFSISDCPQFTDGLMKSLGMAVPRLWTLTVFRCPITDQGFDHLSGHNLKNVYLRECPGIHGEFLRHYPRISSVRLMGCPIEDRPLRHLLKVERNPALLDGLFLSELNLTGTNIGDESVDVLIKLNLPVYIDGTRITDDGILRLGRGTNKADILFGIDCPQITRLGRLRAYVNSRQYEEDFGDAIRKGVRLVMSERGDGTCLRAHGKDLRDEEVRMGSIGNLANDLVEIDFQGPMLTDELLRILAEPHQLTKSVYLRIQFAKLQGAFSDEAVTHLLKQTELRELVICSERLTNRGLAGLAGLPKLEKLTIESTAVDDGALPAIEACKTLKSANLEKTHMTALGREQLDNALRARQ